MHLINEKWDLQTEKWRRLRNRERKQVKKEKSSQGCEKLARTLTDGDANRK